MHEPGTLTLVGTPLGHMGDLSPRARDALAKATLIACEDTRRCGQLFRILGLKPPALVAFHKDNEHERTPDLITRLKNGQNIVLMSDGGMPAISDPGAPLVAAARKENLRVDSVPGPTAVTTVMAASGFAGPFAFVGFPPRKATELKAALQAWARLDMAVILYESPNRVKKTVAAACEVCPDRPAWLVREVTKMHEEWVGPTWAGIAATLEQRDTLRGECVLVMDAPRKDQTRPDEPPECDEAALRKELDNGETVKTLAARMAAESGISRSECYRRIQALKGR